MPSIPHSVLAPLLLYSGPLAALLLALALPFVVRGKAWVIAPAPVALLAGWALLLKVSLLPRAIWMPNRGIETLLAPALACLLGVAVLAWRGGRSGRLVAVAVAVFAGWWVARENVGLTDFWRVWFAIGVLAAVLSRVVKDSADRSLVVALALWGGLAVAGAGQSWLLAACVATACAAGLVAARVPAAVPAAAMAALIGASELAGGRLLRGRVGLVDVACLAAIASPYLADLVTPRLPRLPPVVSAVLSRVIGAGATIGLVWVARRAFFT